MNIRNCRSMLSTACHVHVTEGVLLAARDAVAAISRNGQRQMACCRPEGKLALVQSRYKPHLNQGTIAVLTCVA